MSATKRTRAQFCDEISSVPYLKKLLLCLVIERKKRRIANAYARAAVDDILYHNGELFYALRDRADVLFSEIYGVELPDETSTTPTK